MINDIFQKILVLSVEGSILGLVVFLIAKIFRDKLPSKARYFMYILVFIKLILPIDFKSIFSIFNFIGTNKLIDSSRNLGESVLFNGSSNSNFSLFTCLCVIWILGMISFSAYILMFYYNLKIKVYKYQVEIDDDSIYDISQECFEKTNIAKDTEVVFSAAIKSPFVFGFGNPLIVLPYTLLNDMTKDQIKQVIVHEAMHIKLRHNIIKHIITIVNIIQWFNPLVWIFSKLVQKEAEFDCDYEVTRKYEADDKCVYTSALLTMAVHENNNLASLSFGESNLKVRISSVLNRKSLSKTASIISIFILCILSLSFLTAANENRASITPEASTNQELNSTDTIPNTTASQPSDINIDTNGINLSIPGINIHAGENGVNLSGPGFNINAEDKEVNINGQQFNNK